MPLSKILHNKWSTWTKKWCIVQWQSTENYYNYWYVQNNFSLSTKSMPVSDLRCSEP